MPAPDGPESSVEDEARKLVASSTTFQTLVGFPADPTNAKTRVYLGRRTAVTRPFALIGSDGSWEYLDVGANPGDWPRGELFLMFEIAVASGDAADPEASKTAFMNQCGKIVAEILANSIIGGYLIVRDIRRRWGPKRSHKREKNTEGDYYQAGYGMLFGLES